MKILFLADNFPPEHNAQASLVFERACFWVKWGHDVTVLTCAPNFPEGKVYPGYRNRYQVEYMSGIRVVRVKTFIAANSGKFLRILDYLSYMAAACAFGSFQPKPELIVATSPQFFTAVTGWLLAAVRGVPFVMEVRDLWPESIVAVGAMRRNIALQWIEKLELFLYKKAALVVVLTNAFRENLLERGVPQDKIRVIVSGVDLTRYSPVERSVELAERWGIRKDDFVIGYIGTFGMAHGLKSVLDAAELLRDPHLRFMLVGTGHARKELEDELERRGLKNVICIPAQPKEVIRDFWGLCDVSLVHLRNSPLFKTVIPSKIFESMGMGLPVLLASPEGEASRIVKKHNIGVCIEPEDPNALASISAQLRQSEALRSSLARNSLAAAQQYSREAQSKEMLQALEAACFGIRPFVLPRIEPLPPLSSEQKCHAMSSSLIALATELNKFRAQPVVDVEVSVEDQSPLHPRPR